MRSAMSIRLSLGEFLSTSTMSRRSGGDRCSTTQTLDPFQAAAMRRAGPIIDVLWRRAAIRLDIEEARFTTAAESADRGVYNTLSRPRTMNRWRICGWRSGSGDIH